jgi:hypothetical protein
MAVASGLPTWRSLAAVAVATPLVILVVRG